jgi:hypothetical protein
MLCSMQTIVFALSNSVPQRFSRKVAGFRLLHFLYSDGSAYLNRRSTVKTGYGRQLLDQSIYLGQIAFDDSPLIGAKGHLLQVASD